MNAKNIIKPKVVVLGGGTGTFTVLTGLKKHPVDLTAIVAMADDGGSTGVLRDELGVLPPGDVRQCLVALSRSDKLMRDLMNYRFEHGGMRGHNFGNILLSTLEKVIGSFDKAVERVSEVLAIDGQVCPATLDNVELVAHLDTHSVRGEQLIRASNLTSLQKIELIPTAKANKKALKAVKDADVIVVGPGDIYTSLLPNLLVKDIAKAVCQSSALKVYVCNLMAKSIHAEDLDVDGACRMVEKYLGGTFDKVLYNNSPLDAELVKKYALEGEEPVLARHMLSSDKFVPANLVSKQFPKAVKGDPLGKGRNLVRHDSPRLAKAIMALILERDVNASQQHFLSTLKMELESKKVSSKKKRQFAS